MLKKIELLSKEDILPKNRFSAEYSEYIKILRSFEHFSYFENPECHQYMEYIKQFVESILDVKFTYKNNKSIDFISNFNDEELKIKHVSSYRQEEECWKYAIGHNKIADAFLLSAFGNEFEPKHLWFIRSNEVLSPKAISNKRFKKRKKIWDRDSLSICSLEMICYFEKFELLDKLEQLKSIIKMGYHKPKYEIPVLLIKKKQEELGNRSVKYIVEEAIREAFDYQYGSECFNVVIERQKQIFEFTGKMPSIKEVIYSGIELGIDSVK